jgi:putative membrane protein
MNSTHHINSFGILPQLLLSGPFVLATILYIVATVKSSRYYKQWPLYRTIFWVVGVVCAIFSVIGPLAQLSHIDFTAHMVGHLLLGMLAPLLMVLGAPMTLALRTINVTTARRLSNLLKMWPVRIVSNPIVASVLNVGGLWILYSTNLYATMHDNLFLHTFIHFHVFMAGYLFTVSMIYIDPTPHRYRFVFRATVMVLTLAGHGILSKYIYSHPPAGVPLPQAEIGGMLMYYGGDLIDIVLIYILCFQWYRATRPRVTMTFSQT